MICHRNNIFRTTPILLAIIAICATFFIGCNQQQKEFAAPPPPQVTVEKPVVKDVTRYADYTGTTRAKNFVELRARVKGYLKSVNFKNSTMVNKGDLLFVIEQRPYEATVNQAKADLSISRAELKVAEVTLKRKSSAYKERAVSEIDVLDARAQRDKASASVDASKAALEAAELELSYTEVRAPISGWIDRNYVDAGNLVGSGEATLLATIVQLDPMYAYFSITERDLLYFIKHRDPGQANMPIEERPPHPLAMGFGDTKDYPFQGVADYMDNQVDAGTGTIQARGLFNNPDKAMMPGMFARIRIPIATITDALTVSERAFGSDQLGWYVRVVNDQNIVEQRTVEVGSVEDGMRVVTKGITKDDRVVTNGLQRAQPGRTVTPMTPEELKNAAQKAKQQKAQAN